LADEEFEHGKWVALINNPPEEETYRKGYSWKNNHGRVWHYDHDGDCYISNINLLAWVRAIRDELADPIQPGIHPGSARIRFLTLAVIIF
jgi:hypothetical protein